jgi:hypothetical protein
MSSGHDLLQQPQQAVAQRRAATSTADYALPGGAKLPPVARYMGAAQVSHLQRTAGNTAVAQLLTAPPLPAAVHVQRSGCTPGGSCCSDCASQEPEDAVEA